MSETLRQQQSRFALAVSKLIAQAYAMGYEVTLGDAYRDPRVFGDFGTAKGYGRASSQHKRRLAIDLNLFKDGRFLSSTESHRPLGEWWQRQHPDAVWGGLFPTPDGNHYAFTRGGYK